MVALAATIHAFFGNDGQCDRQKKSWMPVTGTGMTIERD